MEVKTTMFSKPLLRVGLRQNNLTLFFKNGDRLSLKLDKGEAMILVQKLWKIVNT